jgi:hypothetical protein
MTGTTAGVIVSKTPYDSIAELPPDQRPEGDNVSWIPGYWSYDDDRSDFIWVSGVWRDLPPGRQWVPGYWSPVSNGSQWISGFWGDAAQTEMTYLPAPPQALEAGPSSPIPGPGNQWAPGNWVWQQSSYYWQPGYWVPQQPNWVWTPSRYTWTPRGYVYVGGYWDHDIINRGVMFAPVYYDQPVYRRPNYSYSPSTVIDLAVIVASLFVQPRSNHYYYGDYYDSRYEDRGIYPWHSQHVRRYGDDPIYTHYRSSQLSQYPNWDNQVDEQYRYRRDHRDARPPQTLALQVNFNNNRTDGDRSSGIIGRSLADAIQSKALPQRFTPVNMDERKKFESRGRDVHRFQFERAVKEAPPRDPGKARQARETKQPVRIQLPVSPVAAGPADNVEGARTPPPLPVAPQPQAVDRKRSRTKPQKSEAATETLAPQGDQGRVKPYEKPRPERGTARPTPTRGTIVRKGPGPETSSLVSDPPTRAPNKGPSYGQERNAVKSKARASKPTDEPRYQKKDSGPEAKASDSSYGRVERKTVEAKRENPRPVASDARVNSYKKDSKAQAPRVNGKRGKGTPIQGSAIEDGKDKKRN